MHGRVEGGRDRVARVGAADGPVGGRHHFRSGDGVGDALGHGGLAVDSRGGDLVAVVLGVGAVDV